MRNIRKYKNHSILIGSLIILVGIILPLSKYLYFGYLNSKNIRDVDAFFMKIDQENNIDSIANESKETNDSKYYNNYIAVLEIPSISLKRGLFEKNSNENNISKNIEILNESDMPDVLNGTMYLASHSGTSYISFFKHINKLVDGDLIYVYYNNIKYTYKVTDIYEEVKDGDISVYKDSSKTNLILTTCSKDRKNYQLVISSELIEQATY
jgi:LPXTG-site transpeptidase (sortase) family protein